MDILASPYNCSAPMRHVTLNRLSAILSIIVPYGPRPEIWKVTLTFVYLPGTGRLARGQLWLTAGFFSSKPRWPYLYLWPHKLGFRRCCLCSLQTLPEQK